MNDSRSPQWVPEENKSYGDSDIGVMVTVHLLASPQYLHESGSVFSTERQASMRQPDLWREDRQKSILVGQHGECGQWGTGAQSGLRCASPGLEP